MTVRLEIRQRFGKGSDSGHPQKNAVRCIDYRT
jgi:hypothetical protein